MDRKKLRRIALRGLLALILLCALVEGAWIVGAPIALRRQLLPRLNRRPAVQTVAWELIDPGIVPGRVKVLGLAIERRHATAAWTARLDEAEARIALRSLFGRELRVKRLRARGLDLIVRRELPAAGDAAAARPPRRRHPWTYRFDDAEIDGIREVAVGAYRFQGQASLATRCRIRPREAPRIDEARLRLDAGSVTIAGQPILGEMAGTAEAVTTGPPGEGRPAAEFVRLANVGVRVTARTPRLTPEPFSLPTLPWLRLLGGAARVDVDLSASDAKLLPGSRFDLRVDDMSVAIPGRIVRGTGSVIGRVAGDASAPDAQVKVTFDEFELANEGQPPHARGRGLWLGLSTPVTDLRRPAERFTLVAEIPESEVTDLSAYAAHVPRSAGLVVRGGAATLSASLRATERDGSADVHLRVQRADATWKGTRLLGDLALDSALTQLDLAEGSFRIDGTTVNLSDWTVASAQGSATGWWAKLAIPEGRVAAKEPVKLAARVTGTLRDSGPLFELLGARPSLRKLARFLLTDEDIAVAADLEVREDRFAARDIDVRGRKLAAKGCLSEEPGGLHAITWVDQGMLSAGVRRAPGDTSVRPLASKRWWDEHRGECR